MEFPFTPGAEVAGEVLEVGGAVRSVAVGDAVLCTVPFGGAAQQIVVSDSELVRKPPHMSWEVRRPSTLVLGDYVIVQRFFVRKP